MKNYFLLISPSFQIKHKVLQQKQLVRQELGYSYESEFSIAHITLKQYFDMRNDAILYDISDHILPRVKPFMIQVDGFDVFDHGATRTIYLKIIFRNVVGELIEEISGKKGAPHITVAKNLRPKEFNKIWPFFKEKECKAFFICDAITVLHGHPGAWRHYTELPLAA